MSLPTVLVVDDHPLFRRGVIGLLEGSGRFAVAGEAADPETAASEQQRVRADVVLLDLRLKHASGLSSMADIQAAHRDARIIVLTMYDEAEFRRAARAAGAHGYVVKDAADTELLAAIDRVLGGGVWFGEAETNTGRHMSAKKAQLRMTDREREVVRLLARGHTNRSVGEKLGISVKTVEGYRQRVMDKFGFRSRIDLVRFALELGLVGTGETPAIED